MIQDDSIERNSNSTSTSDDLSQLSKSIKDEDKDKFDSFRSQMKTLNNNRSSLINHTFQRNYYPSQQNDENENDDYHRDYDNGYEHGNRQRPILPPKPLTLKRHDVRNKNHYEDNYNYT